jgi:hypothetical protein
VALLGHDLDATVGCTGERAVLNRDMKALACLLPM